MEKTINFSNIDPTNVQIRTAQGTREQIALKDQHGFFLSQEEAADYLKEHKNVYLKAKEFYDLPNIEESIGKANKETHIELYSTFSFNVDFERNKDGKFIIPEGNVKYKQFKDNLKRDWSFQCGWCGKKVSSKIEKDYYSIDFPHIPDLEHKHFERACSLNCGQHIWQDVFKNWIYKRDYQDLFEINN